MFGSVSTEELINGKMPDGSSMLHAFLKEYSRTFNVPVSVTECISCIRDYLNKYQRAMKIQENQSDYELHLKYEGIVCDFGSSLIVTNENLTNELAEKLIEKYQIISEKNGKSFDISEMFSKFPQKQKEEQKSDQPKKRGKK